MCFRRIIKILFHNYTKHIKMLLITCVDFDIFFFVKRLKHCTIVCKSLGFSFRPSIYFDNYWMSRQRHYVLKSKVITYCVGFYARMYVCV